MPLGLPRRDARLAGVGNPAPVLVVAYDAAAVGAALLVPLGALGPAFGLAIPAQARDSIPVLVVMKSASAISTRSLVPLAHVDLFSKELMASFMPADTYLTTEPLSVKNKNTLSKANIHSS